MSWQHLNQPQGWIGVISLSLSLSSRPCENGDVTVRLFYTGYNAASFEVFVRKREWVCVWGAVCVCVRPGNGVGRLFGWMRGSRDACLRLFICGGEGRGGPTVAVCAGEERGCLSVVGSVWAAGLDRSPYV